MKKATRSTLALLLLAACHGRAPSAADAGAAPAGAPAVDVIAVVQKQIQVTEVVPAEIYGYLWIAMFPRVPAFAEEVLVDRSYRVHEGELLARLSAPELVADRAQAEATWIGDRATLVRLRQAARTPGAVAKNEVELAQAKVKADLDRVRALRTLEGYLDVIAPFDGVVIERDVHPGALVGPSSGPESLPLFRLVQTSRLRVTGAVPEAYVSGLQVGAPASFTVRAWPGRTFTGVIRRPAHALDQKTRTMPVELDFENAKGEIAPGMYAEILWPVERPGQSLLVLASSIVSTPEALFVDRIRNGKVERVTVKRGFADGKWTEVFGALRPGDLVAVEGSAELVPGSPAAPRPVSPPRAER